MMFTLAITIPTYNRAPLLALLLDSVFQDYDAASWPSDLQLIVMDNASSDNTVELVEKRIFEGYPITLVKNEENIGVDANLCNCFSSAHARYVWQIGDDEILYAGTVKWVLEFCRVQNFGLLHLESVGFLNGQQKQHLDQSIGDKVKIKKLSSEKIFRRVNIYLTFISANIVNKNELLKFQPDFDAKSEMNTNLVQLAWIYGALNLNLSHHHVTTPMLGALAGNSGGYKLIQVFGENLVKITDHYFRKTNFNAAAIVTNAVLTRLFPSEIYAQNKAIKNNFDSEEMSAKLKTLFSDKVYFKIFVAPLFSSILLIRKLCMALLLIFNKINRISNYKLL